MRPFILVISFFFPWPLRRLILEKVLGYQIHPTCRIGVSWVLPQKLVMENYSTIGHLNVFKGLDCVHLKKYARIGRGNWITGLSSKNVSHFCDQDNRRPQLVVGEHSAITNRHLIDCTDSVTIGDFSIFAGFQSQVLSHSIDFINSKQLSLPIKIGDYCFVGTNCVLLGGSSLPDYSVLGAKALLNKNFNESYYLYGGVPAKPIKILSQKSQYFNRIRGFVD